MKTDSSGGKARRFFGGRTTVSVAVGLFLLAGVASRSAVAQGSPQSAPPANQKLAAAVRLAEAYLKAMDQVRDYEAVFVKKERVGKRLKTQKMFLKLREQPFSVYIRFLQPNAGREVIYVAGRNNGYILAHGTGAEALAGTVRIHPYSREAMKESRYPITMAGMRNMLRKVIEQWKRELNDPDVQVTYYPNAKLGNVACVVLQTVHTRAHHDAHFYMTRLFIDKERRLPIRVEQYGFPRKAGESPPLVEEYTYLNVRVNVGLTDFDFETSNPSYDF